MMRYDAIWYDMIRLSSVQLEMYYSANIFEWPYYWNLMCFLSLLIMFRKLCDKTTSQKIWLRRRLNPSAEVSIHLHYLFYSPRKTWWEEQSMKQPYLQSFFGKALLCWTPVQFRGGWDEYADDFCFVENTYFVPVNNRSLPDDNDVRENAKLPYYQVLLVQRWSILIFI